MDPPPDSRSEVKLATIITILLAFLIYLFINCALRLSSTTIRHCDFLDGLIMADQQQPQSQQQRMQAPFPAPPPFYHHFTQENARELRRRRKDAGIPTKPSENISDSEGKRDLDPLSLPPELRYFIPPPPPTTDTFQTFGLDRSLTAAEPSLSDTTYQHIPRLYPDHPSVHQNPQPHLLTLVRSQLTTFLLLIGNLSQNATEGWEPPTKDLEGLNYNMQELVNRYRPHQARETLILMMEERVRRMREEVKAVREGRERVGSVMERLRAECGGAEGEGGEMEVDGKVGKEDEVDAERKKRQRGAWVALEGAVSGS